MTHLENYLDCLKLLPNELSRNLLWVGELDRRSMELKKQLDLLEIQIISQANQGVLPTIDTLKEVRLYQRQLNRLHHEKSSLCKQSRDQMMSYSNRLDEDIKVFEQEMPPDMLKEAIEEAEVALQTHSGNYQNNQNNHSNSFNQFNSLGTAKSNKNKHSNNSKNSSFNQHSNKNKSSSKSSSSSNQRRDYEDQLSMEDFNNDAFVDAGDLGLNNLNMGTPHNNQNTGGVGGSPSNQHMYDVDNNGDIIGGGNMDNGGMGVGFDSNIGLNEDLYCFCKKPSYGEMVACDNPHCKIEWFHLACVGLKKAPKGNWVCPDCKKKNKS